ncbi:hypothetical protein C9E89_011195 [Acinetobacter sichuanensis]|uniref:Uncharacterized protein n=1 Tax=Acinetobacter sichuanensis TaxID=2136183 RepID=A0A371YPK9_9GAMM|nr:hypothetical protein C9E89_011195 [Acinetobacter sichuanensis]
MSIYKIHIDINLLRKTFKIINLRIYQKNCEIFTHTATLLIHNLKYLTRVSYCFTKGKNEGRV